jgi:hypothetical protein
MRLSTSFRTVAAPDRAWAIVRDFGRIEDWDPFIASVDRLDPGEPRVGSRYVLRSKGPGLRLRYEVETLDDDARRVRLLGAATGYRGWDEIVVAPDPDGSPGSRVTYAAEILLSGRARLLWLLAPVMLGFMLLSGGRAMRGFQRLLDREA